jgi:phosphoribosylaminoimidazolecarboxamide formyltransferase/IMP cyclohydrolase
MNTQFKTIQSAYFSKEGLKVKKLHSQNVILYSTGGTEDFKKLRYTCCPSWRCHFLPPSLGWRVKHYTKSFGGILNRQDNESDVQQMRFDILKLFG